MSSKPKKKVVITPIEIPPEFKDKVNSVRSRILFLSPSVMRGEERECRKDDFESISNSNIGVGGFGKVYKVRHKVSKNVFAIKVINKKKIIEHDLVEQIKLEVKIMYKLNHDHILKLYNHYEDDDNFYLILQYCAKGQIYSLLKKEGRFNEKTAAQYLRECISAVNYLHSLDPPIIHRDIKPENILLDSSGIVKVADFGWSNYFDDDNRRLTYCGTPEYLAPEMIKQSGHDKSLDVWNLGVLLFELLTGSPPFEGGSQNELFQNILALKIKWPKGFSGIAKDLISKLLKIEPKNRIVISEITEHPWFKSIPQIREVSTHVQPKNSNKLLENELQKQDYQVVSKPSVTNKAEANEENSRQSVLDKKLNKVKKLTSPSNQASGIKAKDTEAQMQGAIDSARQDNAKVQDLQMKLQKYKKENLDLKYEIQKKCNENEQKDKKIQEQDGLIQELKKYHNGPSGMQSSAASGQASEQIRQLQDEIQRLKQMTKNRDDILNEIDTKNQNLRETETRLKLAQNEQEVFETKVKQFEAINKEYMEKNEDLEKRITNLKEQQQKTQREKDQEQIQLNQKIEILQYKLLNGNSSKENANESQANAGSSAENTFKELLQLCKGDLDEITKKLVMISQYEQSEDHFRKEIIDQGRKMNELRNEHERQIFEQSQENNGKLDQMQSRYDQDKKKSSHKHKEELQIKNEKLIDLERQLQRNKAMMEKAESSNRQIDDLKEVNRSLATDKDMVKQEKELLEDKCTRLKEELNQLKDRFNAKYKP